MRALSLAGASLALGAVSAAARQAQSAVGSLGAALPFLPGRSADRPNGGSRGKPHLDKPRKRSNRLHVSRRVRRKARRA